MRATLNRPALALLAIAGAAQIVTAAEPPSSAWVPPLYPEVRIATAAEPEPTAVFGDLPAPAAESDSAAANDEDISGDFGGPWLLGDDDLEDAAVETDEANWYVPTRWFGGLPWDTGIELGLNGSSGNNESISIRTGGYVKRKSRFSKFDYSLYYNRTTSGQETTQDNATTDIRNDWLLDETSPWSLYGKANLFYDRFQEFDLQTNASTGLGYQIFKDSMINLSTRMGGGTSREFGGPDDKWVPEALLGFEYDQHVSETQKFYATFEYYPEFSDFRNYRYVADGGWEVQLDKPSNLSLKISANDRYDSTPNDAEAHLINYSVLLLLKL